MSTFLSFLIFFLTYIQSVLYKNPELHWSIPEEVFAWLRKNSKGKFKTKQPTTVQKALTWSIVTDNEQAVLDLINSASKKELETVFNDIDENPVCWAARMGNLDALNEFHDRDADLSVTDIHNQTARCYASLADALKLLISSGAELPSLRGGKQLKNTDLTIAAENGDSEMLEYLFYTNPSANEVKVQMHALKLLSRTDNERYMQFVLCYAIKNQQVETVAELLDNGASAMAREAFFDKAPLDYALKTHNTEIIKMLLEKNGEIVHYADVLRNFSKNI